MVNDTTRKFARTLRETEADPMAWWATAEAEAAKEEFIRAQFNGEREPDAWRWPHLLTYSIGAMFAALYLLGYFN